MKREQEKKLGEKKGNSNKIKYLMCEFEEMQYTFFSQKNRMKCKLHFTRRGTQAKNEIYSKLNLKRSNCIDVKPSNAICDAVLFLGGKRSISLQERMRRITYKTIQVFTSFAHLKM